MHGDMSRIARMKNVRASLRGVDRSMHPQRHNAPLSRVAVACTGMCADVCVTVGLKSQSEACDVKTGTCAEHSLAMAAEPGSIYGN